MNRKTAVAGVLMHIVIVAAGLFFLVLLPLWASGGLGRLRPGSVDAVSGASVTIDQPSGSYVILINTARHPDKDKLDQWCDFFSGREVSYIMEDISCSVMNGDTGADTMAQSFQSRLAEHQMTIYRDDPTMLVSRADAGKYDLIILSREYAEAYRAEEGLGTDSLILTIDGDPSGQETEAA